MHRRQGNLTEAIASFALSLLERVSAAWARLYFAVLVAPLLDPSRTFSARETWAMVRHLYKSEAHLARATFRTARRLAGLPRMATPLDAFFLPGLKSPRHIFHRMQRHYYALHHSRRLAIRLARRWRLEAEAHARDPLHHLRGAPTTTAAMAAAAGAAGAETGISRLGKIVVAVVVAARGIRGPPWRLNSEKPGYAPCCPTSEVAAICARYFVPYIRSPASPRPGTM